MIMPLIGNHDLETRKFFADHLKDSKYKFDGKISSSIFDTHKIISLFLNKMSLEYSEIRALVFYLITNLIKSKCP